MADFNRIARERLESLGAYKQCDKEPESPSSPKVEGEDATTRYEVLAESFFLRYGELAPGKDRGVESARIDADRVLSHLWRTWLSEKNALTQNLILAERVAELETANYKDAFRLRAAVRVTEYALESAGLRKRIAELEHTLAIANEPDEVITTVREALDVVLTANVTTARKSLMEVLTKARHAIDVLVVRAAMGAKQYASLCALSKKDGERIKELELDNEQLRTGYVTGYIPCETYRARIKELEKVATQYDTLHSSVCAATVLLTNASVDPTRMYAAHDTLRLALIDVANAMQERAE